MNGLECSHWLTREGLTGALEHLRTDAQNRPVRRSGGKMSAPVGGFGFGEFALGHCAMQGPLAFDERQIRGDDELLCGQQFTHLRSRFFIQKPCQDGT